MRRRQGGALRRDTIHKRIYHVLAAFVAALGVTVTVVSVDRGDAGDACIGLAIILGAVAAVVVHHALDRLNRSVTALADRLVEIRRRFDDGERRISGERKDDPCDSLLVSTSAGASPSHAVVDLAAAGHGDPRRIIAATLDRSVYPRLAETLDEQPPATTPDTRNRVPLDDTGGSDPEPSEEGAAAAVAAPQSDVDGVAHKNVLRIWKQAVRAGDLIACRSVYSILVDTVDPRLVARLEIQMQALADRTEHQLRAQFAQRVRQRDVEGVLRVGDQMCELLPDRPIAEEFRRLKPLLSCNMDRTASRPSGSDRTPQAG